MSKESKAYKNLPKKVYIRTFGCQMNVRDSEVIAGLLRAKSYELTVNADDADIIILNTCSVRQHAEDKVWSEIGRFSKRNTPACRSGRHGAIRNTKPIIGLIGCMAQNYKDKIFERAPTVDFVVGPSDIDKIPQIINKVTRSQGRKVARNNLLERKIWETDGTFRPEEIYHTGFYEDKNHAYVVISEGCSNYCSYCVVPYVRGHLRNRNHKEMFREIGRAIDEGITKITLLGQNVNAYKDDGVDFVKLVRLVNSVKGLKEFSFVTSHPRDTSVELFKAMQDCEKIKKYLHLPVQSGSDRILKLMNRGYTRKFYLDLTGTYRTIVKGAALSTDIIVGYPGESEEDFRKTYDLLEGVRFDSAYIFKYSPRPYTQAANLADDIPEAEKERRHGIILELQKEISRKK